MNMGLERSGRKGKGGGEEKEKYKKGKGQEAKRRNKFEFIEFCLTEVNAIPESLLYGT